MAGKYAFAGVLLALLLVAGPRTGAQTTPAADGELVLTGQTEPSATVEITSSAPGQLVEVQAVEGQAIKKGDPIARLDDAIEKLAVELKALEANSTAEVRSAEDQVAHAQTELEQYQKLGTNDSQLRQLQIDYKESQLALGKNERTKPAAQAGA